MRKSGLGLALLFSLIAPIKAVYAEAIMISGKLQADLPAVSFDPGPGDFVAYVNSNTITASGAGTACNVTVDDRATSSVDNLVCFFEWLPNTLGFTSNGFTLSGVPNTTGDLKLPYKISYFSGSERKKVEIVKGEYSIKSVAPVKPTITGLKSSLNGLVYDGFSFKSYLKDEAIKDIAVSVEPRNYIQYISIGSGSACEVPIGGTSCTIEVGSIKASDTDELLGSRDITITANSKNNYFAPPESKKLVVNWDYRPPVVDHTLWNFTDEAKTIKVGGQDIYTGAKTVAVAVKVPQQETEGEWWLPTAMSLTMTPDGVFKPTTKVTLDDGTEIDFKQSWATPLRRTLQPVSGPQKVGDEYLYIFDLTDLINGSYAATFTVENTSKNSSTYTEPESKLMLSDNPTLMVLKDGQVLTKRAPVYFLNEIIVAAFQGQAGVADIKSVTIDNKVVSLTPTNYRGIYYLPVGDDLAVNSDHEITVVAENLYGKNVNFSTVFTYQPTGFTLKNLEKNVTLYSRVRQYTDLLSQTAGDKCTLFTTEENANAYLAWYGEKSDVTACYPQWNNVPDGLEFYFKGRTPGLTGFFNKTGENLLDYQVYMINGKGSKAVSARNRRTLTTQLPYNPIISYKKNKVIAGINPNTALAYTTGGEAARILAKVVPADVTMIVSQNGSEAVKTSFKNRSSNNDATTFVQRVKVAAAPLWTKNVFDIAVEYSKDPELRTTDTLNVYTVPVFNIRASMEVDDRKTATSLEVPLKVTVGRYNNSTRKSAFDRKTMGEWDVTIYSQKSVYGKDPETGRYKTTYERTALTEALPVNDAGIVETKIKIENMDLGNMRLVGVAKVRSPFSDFEMKRETSAVGIRIYKGEELEGNLSKSLIIGRIPLSTLVSFKSASTANSDALAPTEWQQSSDNGQTWNMLSDMTGKRSVSIKKTEVGKWLYRAKMTNKFTSKVSYTDALTVVTYKQPKLSIDVTDILQGSDVPVTLLDNDEPIPAGTAEVLWSEDKVNWVQGDTTYTVASADTLPSTIYARMRYLDSDELAEESSWKETSARLAAAKPKRLSVSVTGVSKVEVGQKVTLEGKFTNPNSKYQNGNNVVEEWKTPDGQTFKGSTLSVTLTEQMLDKQGYAAFEYSAWLADNKENTVSTRRVSVKSWVYKFPEMKISSKLKYDMAPTTLRVALSGIKDGDYPGVTYSREWIYDKENLVITKDEGDTKEFTIENPGKYTLMVVFKDNRNNEQRIENTFVVDEQTPMNVEMTPKFSNKYMRAPLDVTLRSNIKLSHSADSIDTVTYKVNGEVIPSGKNYWAQLISGLKEKKYEITIDVVSKLGQRGSASVEFDVVKNAVPNCTLSYTETNLSWSFTNKCDDTDGKMVRYEWFINGELRNVFGSTATLSKNLNRGKQDIKVIAYDDSGDFATQHVTVFGPAEEASKSENTVSIPSSE
ncbi:TPA: IncHI-type conjugal transfer protein RSP [Salmonella enterica subsp. enterica serovar Schwarzengrund]